MPIIEVSKLITIQHRFTGTTETKYKYTFTINNIDFIPDAVILKSVKFVDLEPLINTSPFIKIYSSIIDNELLWSNLIAPISISGLANPIVDYIPIGNVTETPNIEFHINKQIKGVHSITMLYDNDTIITDNGDKYITLLLQFVKYKK